MDVDTVDENETPAESQKAAGKKPLSLPVDDAHPLDLDAITSSYTDRSIVERLVHITAACPAVAVQALQLALDQVFKMRDTNLYFSVRSAYEQCQGNSQGQLPPITEIAPLDQKWIDETAAKNAAEKNKLEVELKTYSSNMIKESIRMAHRDLANYYRAVGDQASALKHYTKSREFCTTSHHVLDMCFSIIELLIEHRNYAHMSTYVFKADAALDATASTARPTGPTAPANSSANRVLTEREKVQSKLDAGLGLSHFGQGQYEKAANFFVKVGPIKSLGTWIGTVIAPGDIAVYGTLCALATFPRPQISSQILNNDGFGAFIEQEPYVRELIEAYMSNRFKDVLGILEKYSTRHAVDPHLGAHIQILIKLITNRALVLFFQPFVSIRLERMSTAFGWTVDELEQHVVALIQSGEIKARVDRQNKILKAKETDQRSVLYARVMKSGEHMASANRKLLLRLRLYVQAPLCNSR
ncbi:hypothetical protein POSPLADRAFT_1154048 [Postia placenta MAD-698-R-SB12]|uniref:PCI domain-containing protein n=1 Tax=Postia placenta MAD-698-R-SB12 TaxID=670580 RepID=A0A1X6MQ85_9APHY|nr:hypothetical protein POSPLADRAFT_1154048 [Postia placenta MAD-698-R-SB12]OSX58352.1 hypothetical protein POSPLADRAFT_1154048 [Postia placenta MAD-698-R-SB12]